MNPKLYEEPPMDIYCPECPACGADPVLRRVGLAGGVMHRVWCSRCKTKTSEFTTWVGAVAAWDRRDVSPRSEL